jgi:lipopolysaccharide transport system ATP-binding protein
MSNTAIRVENLSKRYRIGVKENTHDTAMEAMLDVLRSPLRNLRRLRRLTRFASYENDAADIIWALNDISFDIKQGEAVGVIGRNGSGKSTLLKILSRITPPTSGRAVIVGRASSLLEVGTGFHPELTGRDNIYLNGTVLGMSRKEVDRKLDEIVAFSGVEKFIDTPVKRYSSGMRVRLAFSVAAHLEPEIMLIDEVLAVGDFEFRQKCLGKMENVASDGRTVLFVSHNLAAVQNLCDRTMLLENGRVVAVGETAGVIREYVARGAERSCEFVQAGTSREAVVLKRVAVVDSNGKASAEIRYDEPFRLQIDYKVNSPIRNCVIALGIRTRDGIRVFTTADFDARPERLGLRSVGIYSASVEIPARWLAPNNYIIATYLTGLSPRVIYDRGEKIGFTILDTGTPAGVYSTGNRQGILQPILPWEVQCVCEN